MRWYVSISGEKPIPWRRAGSRCSITLSNSFNLRREANPLATATSPLFTRRSNRFQSQARSQSPGDVTITFNNPGVTFAFQSQARSQSPGDIAMPAACANCNPGFNLRREANPLATQVPRPERAFIGVSISGEKPIPWRRQDQFFSGAIHQGFNLRREANPLATCIHAGNAGLLIGFQSQARSQSPGDLKEGSDQATISAVSISGEKPIPWRHTRIWPEVVVLSFQSQARSQSPGDIQPIILDDIEYLFQSQARSQSPGDSPPYLSPHTQIIVSISGEKPIPWRQVKVTFGRIAPAGFNLRREANPLATTERSRARAEEEAFQSQARSQSPGD